MSKTQKVTPWVVGATVTACASLACQMPTAAPADAGRAAGDRQASRLPDGDESMKNPESHQDEAHRCPVHGVALQSDRVRVIYGLLRAEPAYAEASKARFPLARTFVPGGCVVDPRHTHETVDYCPECRKALQAWNTEHRSGDTHLAPS